MNIIYPINGKNERMGSLFKTPKHLLLYKGIPGIVLSVNNLTNTFKNSKVIILTNESYFNQLNSTFKNNKLVDIRLIEKTNSQIETLLKGTIGLTGPVMFVDCDIIPIKLDYFKLKYPTIFTFENKEKLLNYSNYKINRYGNIVECNEKQKLFKQSGAGIYYFPDVQEFNKNSNECSNVSQVVQKLVKNGSKVKANISSEIYRFGTLQDIYVDNFSFRKLRQNQLSTGFTNNQVTKIGKRVLKIGDTVPYENEWYNNFMNKNKIPKIYKFENNSILMEFIKKDADIVLDDVFDLIDSYKSYSKLNDLNFKSYIDNIKNHLVNNTLITNGDKLLKLLNKLNINPSFSHGDLSVMNIIPTKIGLKLIDPLYNKNKFGSYEIDFAKLCFSFKFYKNDLASFNYIKDKVNLKYMDILIAAECVRVASYKKEYSFIAENLINEL
jgi:hypothetical protein